MINTQYKVYMTPRNGLTTYGSEIDVSDRVSFDGVSNIRRAIDADDYDIGVYSYDDLEIKALNFDGYFNDEQDVRSIFKFGRDLTKVRVVFSQTEIDENSETETTTITFRGLINEEASRLNTETNQIFFKVLSLDSVLRNTQVSGGTISEGMSASQAFEAILDVPKITAVLGVDAANINPGTDFTVSVGSDFDNNTVREALNKLLLASNSVMLIDSSQDIIIRDRAEDDDTSIKNLYGPFDIYGRQNVSKLLDYNTGRHRMFTSIVINGIEKTDSAYAQAFGYRQKSTDLGFLDDNVDGGDIAIAEVAQGLLDEFKTPKLECKIEVKTKYVKDVDLLHRVALNWPLRIKPATTSSFFPVIGVTKIADTSSPLPLTYGPISIPPNVAWKVIERVDNPKNFDTTLKLRQAGTSLEDGYFNFPGSSIIGYAVIGVATIGGTGDSADTWNPSVIGAARVGSTEIA
jgi:hypothetical protein